MKKYIIVGGGTAGWMSAAILSNVLKHTNVEIVLIESPNIATVGVGEATIPSIIDLLRYLNISLEDFIKVTDSTFKLGIKFVDWLRVDHHYWHPFGSVGGKIDTLPFFHHWSLCYENGLKSEYTDFSPAIVMAKNNKFFIPQGNKANLFSSSDYALHFDAIKVAAYLKDFSLKNGVEHISCEVSAVNKDNEKIASLKLTDNRIVTGDFFIDCSGQHALLIEKSLNVGYQDWSEYLPVDRAVAIQSEKNTSLPPYTESIAHEHGWRWKIPLQSRTGNGYVYSSRFCDDETAYKLLLDNIDGEQLTKAHFIKFTTGKRDKIWHQNCLAVGLSSGFLEPLESTSIHLIMKTMLTFMQMLPSESLHQATIDEFNRLMDIEFECIRDFIVAHYCLSQRTDSNFWQWWQTAEIPCSLKQKLNLFMEQGRLVNNDLDLFASDSWYSILAGMDQKPKDIDPLCHISSLQVVKEMLQKRALALQHSTNKIPSHQEYLQQLIFQKVKTI
ncbi:tryptophan halogenase family protein [Shewanella gaetbuli]|uniref:Tryptophan 7-halogenase n=1 Tax=Shewanella gaetbuli TaxID=220752 RepID=A0A9X1ZI68_9GAMM|nr:tryptophan halogenase family protein [Shewanella gaetbuli]MCL1142178.1 tryptophan 7-halogenase [Shewanella gaetbuli]